MHILLIFAFLPYFKISPIGTDVQPHFLLLFFAYLISHAFKTGRLPVYAVTFVLSLQLMIVSLFLNGGAQVISLAVLPLAVDVLSRQPHERIILAAKIATCVLLFGAFLNIIDPGYVSSFVSNFRGSVLRGLNSFTSEPSYLGICGLVLASVFMFFKCSVYWTVSSVILVLGSGSLTAIAPMSIIIFFRYASGKSLVLVPIFVVFCWFGLQYLAQTESRLGYLLYTLSNSPQLLFVDLSFSNRFLRSLGPIVVAWNDLFFPHDFSLPIQFYFDFLSSETDEYVERLSNVATVLVYGLGFLSFPAIVIFCYFARAPFYYWLVVFYVLLTNISIATPFIYIVLALPLMRLHLENRRT